MAIKVSLVFTLIFCSYIFPAEAQVSVLDSLKTQLKNQPLEDSIRVKLLNRIAFETYYRYPEQALRSAFEALKISEKITYSKGTAEAYRQIGLVLWSQANYAGAVEALFKGLHLIEGNAQALQLEADIVGNIGMVYNSLGNYSQALQFLNQSLVHQRALKNISREATMLNNLGDTYRLQNDFTKALEIYSQALKLRVATGNVVTQGTNLRNIGNVYEALGEFDNALENYFKSLQIAESKNDRRGISLARQSVASIFFKKKQYALATQYARESLKFSHEDNQKSTLRDSYKLLWQLAEAQSKSQEALSFYKLFIVYKDSVENTKVSTEISTVRLNYEMQKKQAEIDILTKDKELQDARMARNNTMLASVLIILVLGTILFFRQRSVSKILVKQNLEIIKQKKEIVEQNDELIALNEEIRAQQDEVIAQRDALSEKNHEILVMNIRMMEANENLEKLVAERTSVLEEQNQRLSDYAFHNAHKLRAPLASILGLVNLMHKNPSTDDFDILLEHLKKSSDDLDRVVRSINKTLQEGLDAFPELENHKPTASKIE